VSAPLELTGKKSINNFGYALWLLFGSQAKNIGIIVLTSPASVEGIMAQGGSYPLNLISRDAHTNAGAAYQDTHFEITFGYRFGYFLSNIRVVYRFSSVTAKVLIAMPGISN
jgi:hypothetical protein